MRLFDSVGSVQWKGNLEKTVEKFIIIPGESAIRGSRIGYLRWTDKNYTRKQISFGDGGYIQQASQNFAAEKYPLLGCCTCLRDTQGAHVRTTVARINR